MRDRRERGSLAWIASDFRSLLPGGSAGLMQLMYPPLGHAVMEHSSFMDDPFGRVYRSIPQIWATILTPDATARGLRIRDLHKGIKGVDDRGARYHALDPDTFWWAHATFTWEMFRSVELFHRRGLDERERHALYDETVEWYDRYGVSSRPVPPTLHAFERRFAEICSDGLELTPSAAYAIEIAASGRLALPLIPQAVTRAMRPALRQPGRAVTFGCLPSDLRSRLGVPWSSADRRTFRLLAATLRAGGEVVPDEVNRSALRFSLRQVGARTRDERYAPA
ncbi:MAG: hypothetical protein QOJ00_1039 [Actinomycetota bacterium]|jgi:uncharacterized protein (DUF2236 family)